MGKETDAVTIPAGENDKALRIRRVREDTEHLYAEIIHAAASTYSLPDGSLDVEAVKADARLPDRQAPKILTMAMRAQEKRVEQRAGKGPRVVIYGGLQVPAHGSVQRQDVIEIDVDAEELEDPGD